MLRSLAMVAYSPLRGRKNFFRLAFTFHPVLKESQVLDILQAIAECGETITESMLWCILRKVGEKLGKILKELKENEGKILEGMKEWKFPGLIATRIAMFQWVDFIY